MRLIISIIALLCTPLTTFAKAIDTSVPPDMLEFTVNQCGQMPELMSWGILVLIVLTVLAFFMKGGKNNE